MRVPARRAQPGLNFILITIRKRALHGLDHLIALPTALRAAETLRTMPEPYDTWDEEGEDDTEYDHPSQATVTLIHLVGY